MEPEIDTKPTGATLTKAQAIELNNALAGRRPQVRYLTHFDTDRIYRRGIGDDSTIAKPRITEDDRPEFNKSSRTGKMEQKQIDVITYAENGTLYVLGKSGGISVFDGRSPNLPGSKKRPWYCCFVEKGAPIPKDLLLAKNVNLDPKTGLFHYAFQPAKDMTLAEFKKKLKELDKYIKVIGWEI